ncbi:MAE_28990/MAE_18760 family HEPN-like nuclease [Inquilinus limosus]|uniref:MAE_28990/MAE_18760 family HEPN-like nuclease n=1 Tax=Inquilinus limosus TaxID=171674 RepID=UPI00138B153C
MSPETTLASRLQDDITWRIRELSELVRACNEAKGTRRDALLRASVPVIYAHWEGYFVYATNSYLNFLTEKRLNMGTLRDEFWALTIRRRYKPNQFSGDVQFTRFLLDIRSDVDRIFKKGNFEKINGASNLKSDVVKFCCACIGLNPDVYLGYFEFIDRELVEKRNHIAHGVSLRFSEESVAEYRDKVVDLMRITQNEIENTVVRQLYRKVS